MARILYITYDGILEPLGESQVLQYLEKLSAAHDISLISFEKPNDLDDVDRVTTFQRRTKAAAIEWWPQRYHKAPSVPATAYDVLRGYLTARKIVKRRGIQILHARSYVPSLIGLMVLATRDLRFVFDMRGFWPDEKVDAGTWAHGSCVYRQAKRLERAALLRADVVVSLTEEGVRVLKGFEYLQGVEKDFRVIPTCTNMELFHPPGDVRGGPLNIGYVGNAGGWYLFPPALEAFRYILDLDSSARLTIVNRDQHELIWSTIDDAGIPRDVVTVLSLPFEKVANAMRDMSATIFFIKPVYSKLASAPTKLGEFLACGVPCMVNAGVGDMGRIVSETGVGVVLGSLSPSALKDGARELVAMANDPAVRAKCVQVASDRFSLERGVQAYGEIYDTLTSDIGSTISV